MARFYKKRTQTKGQPPGSLIFIGKQRVEKPYIYVIDYSVDHLEERYIDNINELAPYIESNTTAWIDITGLHDTQLIQQIGEQFEIHSLLLEDILNTGQRAKFDEMDRSIFVTMKMLSLEKESDVVRSEQVSILIHDRFVITFQEQPGDVFEPVRNRIRAGKGRLRKFGTDYLAYTLMDSIVDNYVFLVEHLGEGIEDLELEILDDPDDKVLRKINGYKQELNFISKVIKPAKEIPKGIMRSESPVVEKRTLPYYKDLDDLVTHVIESIDTYRTVTSDYLSLYHTQVSTKLNDVMRVLTIFASMFIPVTFFAGVYGMNFEYFPELEFHWAYPAFWLIVILVIGSMLIYFKRKKWL